jgi:hypothetical protein
MRGEKTAFAEAATTVVAAHILYPANISLVQGG